MAAGWLAIWKDVEKNMREVDGSLVAMDRDNLGQPALLVGVTCPLRLYSSWTMMTIIQ